MKEIRELFPGYRFGWFGQRALDCLGLAHYFDLDLIMCCDYGKDTSLIGSKSKTFVSSIEAESFYRENWTSTHLDQILATKGDEIVEHLKDLSSPINLIVYGATPALQSFS